MALDVKKFKAKDFVKALLVSGYEHDEDDFADSRIHYAGLSASAAAHVFIMSFPEEDNDEHQTQYYVTKLYVTEPVGNKCAAEWAPMPHMNELTAGEVNAYFEGLAYTN